MADEIRYSDIISPDVQRQLDELTATIKELTAELGNLKKATAAEDKEAEDYNDTLRDSVEITDDLLRLLQDERNLKDELKRATDKLKDSTNLSVSEEERLTMAIAKGKEELRSHGFVVRNAIKLSNANKTSMTELSLELGKNRMAYRKLSEEQRKNDKVGGQLLRTIKKQDKAIKTLDAKIGNHQRNVGNYSSALDGLASSMGGFGMNIRVVANSFRTYTSLMKISSQSMAGMTKAAKVLRIALISTGIGAIVVALGTLVGMLSQSSKVTDWFAEKMAYLGGVVDGVLGFLGQMGNALFLLFSGDFSGAADAASTAVENFGETMDKATESAIRLYDAEKKLEGKDGE